MTRRVPDKEAEAFKQTPATPARRIFPSKNKPPNLVFNPSRILTQPLIIQEALWFVQKTA